MKSKTAMELIILLLAFVTFAFYNWPTFLKVWSYVEPLLP